MATYAVLFAAGFATVARAASPDAAVAQCNAGPDACASSDGDEISQLQVPQAGRHKSAFLQSVSEQMELPEKMYTVSGTHFAQGYKTTDALNIQFQGMEEDCENINLNKKLTVAFLSDTFESEMKVFFYKCEKIAGVNKYWFTIGSRSRSDIKKLCDPNLVILIGYDKQHDTYWQDLPFACEPAGPRALVPWNNAFLRQVADQIDLPKKVYTATGTHFAQGYTTDEAKDINKKGMAEDCENINLNKKLSSNFRSDVFNSEMKGFFYKCEKVGDKNKYWFTISSASKCDIKRLCDPSTQYPVVYDEQHDTYWKDLPFSCDQ